MIAIILVTAVIVVPNVDAGITMQKNANNFGPYTLQWKTFDLCKGPKAKNLSSLEVVVRKEADDYIGHINFTFSAASRIDEMKIVVSTFKDNTKSVLWAYNLKDPCQHFLFANLIEKNLKAHNCAVEKGNYEVDINFSELTKSLLGKSFFYGDYVMKATVISKKGNLLCVLTNILVQKKESEKSKETS